MKKLILCFSLIIGSLYSSAQYYAFLRHMAFEGMNKKYAPVITNYAYDASGNLIVALIVNDSCKYFGTGNLVYTEPVVKNPGSILVKIDPSGTILWKKEWLPNNYMNDFFYIYDLTISASNDIYISGRFRGAVDADPGSGTTILNHPNLGGSNGFIIKLDQNGNFQWYNRLGEPMLQTAAPSGAQIYELLELPNGDLICNTQITGSTQFHNSSSSTPINNTNILKHNSALLKINSAGNLIDTAKYGDPSENIIIINHAVTPSNEVVALFEFNDTLKLSNSMSSALLVSDSNKYRNALVFLDQNMNYKSHKLMHKKHVVRKMKVINNHIYTMGFLIDSATLNNSTLINILPSAGNMVIEKFDLQGNNIWSRFIQGTQYLYPLDIAFYANHLIVNYEFDSTVTIGGVQSQISAKNIDMSNLILDDQNGSTIYNIQLKSDSASNTWSNKLATRNNTIVFRNYNRGSTTIDTVNAFSSSNAYQEAGNLIELKLLLPLSTDEMEDEKVYLYPNPATNYITIPKGNGLMYSIYNTSGNIVQDGVINSGNSIDISTLMNGNYILRMKNSVLLFQKSH